MVKLPRVADYSGGGGKAVEVVNKFAFLSGPHKMNLALTFCSYHMSRLLRLTSFQCERGSPSMTSKTSTTTVNNMHITAR